jgi:hypothetical protein
MVGTRWRQVRGERERERERESRESDGAAAG